MYLFRFVAIASLIFLPSTLFASERGTPTGYLGVSPMSAQGSTFVNPMIEAGLFLGGDLLIGIDYGASRFDFGREESEEDHSGMMSGGWGQMLEERWESQESYLDKPNNSTVIGRHQSQGVKVRWFFSEWFNVMLSAQNKSTSGTLDFTLSDGTTSTSSDFTADVAVQSLGVGSQWHMGQGMTMGIDWLVASKAANSFYTVNNVANSSLTSAQELETQETTAKFAKSMNEFLARSGGLTIFMGWSF